MNPVPQWISVGLAMMGCERCGDVVERPSEEGPSYCDSCRKHKHMDCSACGRLIHECEESPCVAVREDEAREAA